jgi:(2Fe-2S) ferredoxin
MPKFEKHIFVCGNQCPPGSPRGCCDPTGQAKLQKLFKQKPAERGLKGKVRANQSGCLDQCEHGPNVVVYPEAVWYGHVTEVDVDEIIESHIIGGKPVERLNHRQRATGFLVGAAGIEPATTGLEIRCSIRLSYAPLSKIYHKHPSEYDAVSH